MYSKLIYSSVINTENEPKTTMPQTNNIAMHWYATTHQNEHCAIEETATALNRDYFDFL